MEKIIKVFIKQISNEKETTLDNLNEANEFFRNIKLSLKDDSNEKFDTYITWSNDQKLATRIEINKKSTWNPLSSDLDNMKSYYSKDDRPDADEIKIMIKAKKYEGLI